MFTGIIESLAEITEITQEKGNLHLTFKSNLTGELKIDQSVSHNGICLTIVAIKENCYTVTAIKETIEKTSIKNWKKGDKVNTERCMLANGRLDGHIVQGHVDTTATCSDIKEEDGSWKFTFTYQSSDITVEKGSITVNGTSLTVVDSHSNSFSVCIIPYTYEFTNFHTLTIDSEVNIEFDIIGKYIAKLFAKNR